MILTDFLHLSHSKWQARSNQSVEKSCNQFVHLTIFFCYISFWLFLTHKFTLRDNLVVSSLLLTSFWPNFNWQFTIYLSLILTYFYDLRLRWFFLSIYNLVLQHMLQSNRLFTCCRSTYTLNLFERWLITLALLWSLLKNKRCSQGFYSGKKILWNLNIWSLFLDNTLKGLVIRWDGWLSLLPMHTAHCWKSQVLVQ